MTAITKRKTRFEKTSIVSNTLTVVCPQGLIVMTVFTIGPYTGIEVVIQ